MKRLILIAIAALLLSGCDTEGVGSESTDNDQVVVERLFTVEGCTMYKFRDGWRNIYWTNCPGTTQYYTGGKNNKHVSVDTNSEFPEHGDSKHVYGGAK